MMEFHLAWVGVAVGHLVWQAIVQLGRKGGSAEDGLVTSDEEWQVSR